MLPVYIMRPQIGLRIAPEDLARLDAVAARLRGMSRHAVAREALRMGLTLLEEDPARIVIVAPPQKAA